jgi:flavin reductase (DIM6/NTAB) family NADH-FMN oxidoreductase RutF
MQINPETVSPTEVYSTMIRAITPRPIAWVSTVSPKGNPNLAPFSFFSGVSSKPAALMFSPVNKPDGSKKDTVVNIESNGQFVVNVVPFSLAQPMLESADDFAYEQSEFAAAGLTPASSKMVSPPRVAESPIQFECELIKIVNVGEGPLAANVIIGKVLLIDVADHVLNEQGKIDPDLVDSIGRMGGRGYCRTTDRFDIKLEN